MNQLLALLRKEVKETLRDKRALMAGLLLSLLAPVMIFAVSKVAVDSATDRTEVYVKFTGAEFAPRLMAALNDANIKPLSEAPEDKARLWDERDIQVIIPDDFASRMEQGYQITVTLKAELGQDALRAPLRRIERTISRYSQEIGSKRLLLRGIDIRLVQPIDIQKQDTALPQSSAAFITLLLGLYLMFAAFISGLSSSIDSSAGERERNVLELLLCQPVKSSNIVLSKMLSASMVAAIGVMLTLTLTIVAVDFIDLSKVGASFTVATSTVTALLCLLLPLCLLASALQLFLGFQAKSFKEAQSTVSMVIMLPAMVPLALNFMNDKPAWLDWTPIAGHSMIIEDLLKGQQADWGLIGLLTVMTLVITGVLIQLMSRRLQSEQVVMSLS